MKIYKRKRQHLVHVDPTVPSSVNMIEEESTIELDEDGDPMVTKTRLAIHVQGASTTASGDDMPDALYELEKLLGPSAYMRICHQCRFGVTHPFQGEEWWCLAHVPDLADSIQKSGKSCTGPLDEVQMVQVSPTDTCHRFERPLVPRGKTPGAPRRR